MSEPAPPACPTHGCSAVLVEGKDFVDRSHGYAWTKTRVWKCPADGSAIFDPPQYRAPPPPEPSP